MTDQEEFDVHVARWNAETRFVSSSTVLINHPSYQAIVAMGQRAVPLILASLAKAPDHFGPALQAITGAQPVAYSDSGDIEAIAKAWLRWGADRGIYKGEI